MRCARAALTEQMESLYLLIPLSVLLVLAIGAVLVWAVLSGQFDALEREGNRIVEDDLHRNDPSSAAPPAHR